MKKNVLNVELFVIAEGKFVLSVIMFFTAKSNQRKKKRKRGLSQK